MSIDVPSEVRQPVGVVPETKSTDKTSATDRTIDRIVGLITSGELAANQRLPPEDKLAERMEVSRGSLREAVRVLAYLGVLDVRVGDGTYVVPKGV